MLLIVVDDLNDWVGSFGGHPQAQTPHLDRLVQSGGMIFSRAYCPASVCCPSRTAVMTGVLPSDSGVYGNGQNLKNAPATRSAMTLPEYFTQQGYVSLSRGKIFHKHPVPNHMDEGQWAFDIWEPTRVDGARSPDTTQGPANGLPYLPDAKAGGSEFDWGATQGRDEGTSDYQTALWFAEQLEVDYEKPFFMAVGISKPHLPWYVPQKYFDLYNLDQITIPDFHEDDLDDILTPAGRKKFAPSNDFRRVKAANAFQEATRAYLAAVSYADDCIGVVLDALEKSPYADNTIVVVWGDHGWFLGEKLRYRKTHLWEESTRVPLIIKVPDLTGSNMTSSRVVNLMDLYPTLVDLCNLPANEAIAGRSIVPLLRNPETPWDFTSLTTMGRGNHTIRSERWRYSRWADGTEELYDHDVDPMEWNNLAGQAEYAQVQEELAKHLPAHDAETSPSNWIDKRALRRQLLEARTSGRSPLALAPPMGWNSFDSYGVYLHEQAALANIEAMAKKLKPYGYDFFVIDNGWFGEYELQPGTNFPAEKHAHDVNLNEYGHFIPSNVYFPNGLEPLAGRCKELGLKLGVHLMRGIPRKAWELDLPIKGTPYTARDIANTDPAVQCKWCQYCYGVDMSKPGAQEWYDGLIQHIADMGVEFIKYDDIVPYPEEVEAVAKAIAKCRQPITLSLSPGGSVDPGAIDSFKKANMLRVTSDIWDDQEGIDRCFEAWRKWQGQEEPGFWIDMDMIPFGQLQLMSPAGKNPDVMAKGDIALAGKGTKRWSQLSKDQMKTFITLRALSASPLMMGGDLPTLDDFSLMLITHPEVIECNQNGKMGELVFDRNGIEVWSVEDGKAPASGWLGCFNRTDEPLDYDLEVPAGYDLRDIWDNETTESSQKATTVSLSIPGRGVKFLRLVN